MGSLPGRHDGMLVLNAGSSTLKFAVYVHGGSRGLERLDRGVIEHAHASRIEEAVHRALDRARVALGSRKLGAAGHRVVLGGLEHSPAVRIDAPELQRLRDLAPLAPLHQPRSLAPIEAIAARHPNLTQVAC